MKTTLILHCHQLDQEIDFDADSVSSPGFPFHSEKMEFPSLYLAVD
jgi:hypothetical protein